MSDGSAVLTVTCVALAAASVALVDPALPSSLLQPAIASSPTARGPTRGG